MEKSAALAKLALANPAIAEEVQYVLTEVVGKLRADALSQSGDYDAARRVVEPLHRAGRLSEDDVYRFAKTRKFEETVVALALLSGVPVDVVETAMLGQQADMALILAKAAGLSWTTAKFVLMLRTSGRGVSAHELEQALVSYEKLATETAHRAVRVYQRGQLYMSEGQDPYHFLAPDLKRATLPQMMDYLSTNSYTSFRVVLELPD